MAIILYSLEKWMFTWLQSATLCHATTSPNTSKVPVVVISPSMPTRQSGSHARYFHDKSRLAGGSCFVNCQDGIGLFGCALLSVSF